MTKIDFSVDDLTKSALKRMVQRLLIATEGEEKAIMREITKQAKVKTNRNELADLKEETRGKAPKIEVEDDEMDDDEKDEES
jgi:hypothetical protein